MAAHDASFYQASEGRPREQRLREQEAVLRAVLTKAVEVSAAVREALAASGLSPRTITLPDLAKLPLLRKDALPAAQAGAPPFGRWLGVRVADLRRIFVSPGPIYDPEGRDPDHWGLAPALHAAGFHRGDVVLNAFSHHLTPAGAMFDGALGVLGCVAVPSGVGNLEIQAKTALDLGASGFIGTPSFLAALLAKMEELRARSPFRVAFISGEPFADSQRTDLERRFRLRIHQGYAIGDLGLIAYECPRRSGLHVDDRVVVELIDPKSGATASGGVPGEVVVTFLNPVYPLLRLATGDLSQFAPGDCPCGRTATRLERILGRLGEAVKVRGIFIHPHELDRAIARHPQVRRYQVIVTRVGLQDELTVRVESDVPDRAALAEAVTQSVRDATRLRATVEIIPPGMVWTEDKKIVDRRTWD